MTGLMLAWQRLLMVLIEHVDLQHLARALHFRLGIPLQLDSLRWL